LPETAAVNSLPFLTTTNYQLSTFLRGSKNTGNPHLLHKAIHFNPLKEENFHKHPLAVPFSTPRLCEKIHGFPPSWLLIH